MLRSGPGFLLLSSLKIFVDHETLDREPPFLVHQKRRPGHLTTAPARGLRGTHFGTEEGGHGQWLCARP